MTDQAAREQDYFWAALMFYTRIPVPASAQHSQHILNRSRKYFPAVGIVIGTIAILVFGVASLLFGTTLSVALSMVATLLATGAFHEDGFADSCDGLGGGWSTEQVLTIMKDSRVGTYATVGLFFMLAIKLLTLVELASGAYPICFAAIYISAHTLSRQISSMVIDSHDYVQDIDLSKVKPITEQRFNSIDKRFSIAICAVPMLVLGILAPLTLLIASAIAMLTAKVFINYCDRRLGGYTGDILGATQQLSELAFYLAAAASLA